MIYLPDPERSTSGWQMIALFVGDGSLAVPVMQRGDTTDTVVVPGGMTADSAWGDDGLRIPLITVLTSDQFVTDRREIDGRVAERLGWTVAGAARTAAVSPHLQERGLWNDPGSGRFVRRGWSSLKWLLSLSTREQRLWEKARRLNDDNQVGVEVLLREPRPRLGLGVNDGLRVVEVYDEGTDRAGSLLVGVPRSDRRFVVRWSDLADVRPVRQSAGLDGRLLPALDYYGTSGVRELHHALKAGDEAAAYRMAVDMAPHVPADAVLIPMPSRTGSGGAGPLLTRYLSELTGRPVADVLRGTSRRSLYDAKRDGVDPRDIDLGLYLTGPVPAGTPVVVDNVVGSGHSARSAIGVLPDAKVLVHAVDRDALGAATADGDRQIDAVDVSSTDTTVGKPTRSYFHLTDDPRFALNPEFVPEDNALAIRPREAAGLYVAKDKGDIEKWINRYGYLRPFVVEIEAPEGSVRDERWGGEGFLPADQFDEVRIKRVIPVDAHAREVFGDYGWVEDTIGRQFDTNEPTPQQQMFGPRVERPGPGYRYDGPDVRDMPDEQVKRLADDAETARVLRYGDDQQIDAVDARESSTPVKLTTKVNTIMPDLTPENSAQFARLMTTVTGLRQDARDRWLSTNLLGFVQGYSTRDWLDPVFADADPDPDAVALLQAWRATLTEHVRAKGGDSVTLHRGVVDKSTDPFVPQRTAHWSNAYNDVRPQSPDAAMIGITSWTSVKSEAKQFGGALVTADIPLDQLVGRFGSIKGEVLVVDDPLVTRALDAWPNDVDGVPAAPFGTFPERYRAARDVPAPSQSVDLLQADTVDRPPRRPISRVPQRATRTQTDRATAERLFNHDLGGGYRSVVRQTSAIPSTSDVASRVMGEIMFGDDVVGVFSRRLSSVGAIQLRNFRLDDEVQRQGVGSRFLAATVDAAAAEGFTRVYVSASSVNDSVGGYVWARAGFDWEDRLTAEMMGEDLLSYVGSADLPIAVKNAGRQLADALMDRRPWKRRDQGGDLIPPDDFPTPNDVAMLGWRDGAESWPGRRFLELRSTDWYGTMRVGGGQQIDALRRGTVAAPEGAHPATPEDRERLKIPPGWVDVFVADDPTNYRQVWARDAQGRSQGKYTAEFEARQEALKFERVKELAGKLDDLDNALVRDMTTDSAAAVTALIRHFGLRPGSMKDTRARKQAYGASTLQARHVRQYPETGRTTLSFMAKSGQKITVSTRDPDIYRLMQQWTEGKQGTDFLFDATDADVRAYLARVIGPGFYPKDLRTLKANVMALEMVRSMRRPTTMTAFRKARNKVADAVAKALGNTRAVTLSGYINPTVFADWEDRV